jgi:competence protein ComEA
VADVELPEIEPVDERGSPWNDLVERARVWVRWVGPGRIASGAGAAVLVAAIGWWLLRSPAAPTEARLPLAAGASTTTTVVSAPEPGGSPAPATSTTTSIVPDVLVVHVAGAVAAPGVYELRPGDRVADAIAAAGGAIAEADPDALNLAAPLLDGDRVAVPERGAAPTGDVVTHAGGDGQAAAGPVNLNAATVGELDELPGVGPATAAAIVAHRQANGPFVSVDDLESVRGIGPAKLEALRELVTV